MPNNPNQLGALWIKESEKGQFMSGYIEIEGKKINIVCFTNRYKKEDKHPDWEILKSKPKNGDRVKQAEDIENGNGISEIE